jgi:hypothetical protein
LDVIETFKKCNLTTTKDYLSVFDTLSNEVHVFPWCGESFKVYTSKLGEKTSCLIKSFCALALLSVEEVNEQIDIDVNNFFFRLNLAKMNFQIRRFPLCQFFLF